MVGASRPGRVLLVFAAVAACHAAVGGAVWFAFLPASRPCELTETVAPDSLPTQSVSEATETPAPGPQPQRMPCPVPIPQPDPSPVRLPALDAQSSLADLLPTPPKARTNPVYLGENLERVPELKLEAPPAEELARTGTLTTEQWVSHKARTSAAALALNDKEEDGFLKALLRTRPDLSGLPFLMGKACRTHGERAAAFKTLAERTQRGDDAGFLANETTSFTEEKLRHYRRAHVALVAQILPVEHAQNLSGRMQMLASSREPEATRELARIAVFSPHDAVRAAALKVLADRPSRESTDVLVAGLRYPWPAVAESAARAIVKLDRKDLIPQLTAMLDEPDPRGPRVEVDGERKVTVVREVVRINHHRNCLLCHAPAVKGKTPEEALTAEIPLPSEPLPSAGGYGGPTRPPQRGLLVRVDVTYLRQDFSAVQEVYDSSSWRTTQRFDFVTRKRVLTPDEARDLRERLSGESPFRAAAAQALRQLKRS
jgi:hypothetical protein